MILHANVHAVETLGRYDFHGVVAGSGRYPVKFREFRTLRVDTAFNLYSQTGRSVTQRLMLLFNNSAPNSLHESETRDRRLILSRFLAELEG